MEWLDPFYKQIWEKAFAEGIPISGTFELTPRCNFNCKMCYVHLKAEDIPKHGKEMNAAEWLRIAREAKAAGTTWLCVTGGEQLLHPEFETIWRGLAEMGFFLTLQTNASLISGKVVDLLEQYPPRQVKITLYGSNEEVYKAVCGVENGFTRVNDGIHTLMSMGIPVTLVSTIIRQNAEDVQKMAFYAYRHRLPWASTGGIKPSLRGADTDAAAVRVRIVDENGSTAPYAQLPVRFEVSGPLELIGPDTVCSDGGMCGAYLKTTGRTGTAVLRITAPQTQPVELTFQVSNNEA